MVLVLYSVWEKNQFFIVRVFLKETNFSYQSCSALPSVHLSTIFWVPTIFYISFIRNNKINSEGRPLLLLSLALSSLLKETECQNYVKKSKMGQRDR